MSFKSLFTKNLSPLLVLFLCTVSLFSFDGNAQVISSVEEITKERKEYIYNSTEEFNIGHFLNGRFYPMKYLGVANSQFVLGEYLVRGDIIYDGVVFKDRLVQYDTYKQLIVMEVNHEDSRFILSIDYEKVSEVLIEDRRFIAYQDSVLEKKIYEIPYEGSQTKALIYRSKSLSRTGATAKLFYELDPINKYYVVNQYGTFRIKGKKDMINAFAEEEKMKDIIKKNKLKFGKSSITTGIIKALSIYEEGTPSF